MMNRQACMFIHQHKIRNVMCVCVSYVCSRYWSGGAVLQLAAVSLQSKVPWLPIQVGTETQSGFTCSHWLVPRWLNVLLSLLQLPDDLMLTSILQLHSQYEQEALQSAVSRPGAANGNATFLFCFVSSSVEPKVCVHIHTVPSFYKDSFANNRAITSVISKLSCARRCFLHQNSGIVSSSSCSWTQLSVCFFLFQTGHGLSSFCLGVAKLQPGFYIHGSVISEIQGLILVTSYTGLVISYKCPWKFSRKNTLWR